MNEMTKALKALNDAAYAAFSASKDSAMDRRDLLNVMYATDKLVDENAIAVSQADPAKVFANVLEELRGLRHEVTRDDEQNEWVVMDKSTWDAIQDDASTALARVAPMPAPRIWPRDDT